MPVIQRFCLTKKNELKVQFPFGDQAAKGVTLDNGVTAFDNGNESTTVPVAHDDGSLQILTVIDGPEAPTRYDYEISVPPGGKMEVVDGGVVSITDAAGKFVGGATPAWAKDAAGNDLNSFYEVNGNTLTQVVEHSAATEYPVVADPWLGVRLFGTITGDFYQGDLRYNGYVTVWGATVLGGGGGVGGYLAGQAIFRTAGWEEWTSAFPAVNNKATLKQQFDCHVAASNYGLVLTGAYNLERSRADRSNWVNGVLNHQCNW